MARTVEFRVKDKSAQKAIERVIKGLSPEKQNLVVKKAAYKTLAAVIREVPVGFTGNTRKSWQANQIDVAHWKVQIDPSNTKAQEVMGFLEDGTKAHGPVKAQALYIPLKGLGLLGWNKDLIYGKHYVLAKWVMGITGLHIVKRAREQSKIWLKEFMVAHIRKVIGRAGV